MSGRPRGFDDTAVVEAAMDVFWSNGYDGSSAEALCQQTGLGRGSLYNAFGSKQQLYEQALLRYQELGIEAQTRILNGPGSAKERLRGLMLWGIEGDLDPRQRRGCMALLAALDRAGKDPAVAEISRVYVVRLEQLLCHLFAVGQRNGEFRGERQLKVQSLHVLDDPNAEALFYAEMDQLTRTVYMQPPPKPPAPPKRNLCWDFQKGRCAQGSMCTFLHEGGGGGAAAAATPADDAVYSAVRAFLSAREEFAYAQLTQDADVGAAARSSGARPEYLTRAIHRLVDQGEIYLRDPHADTYTTIPPLLWIPQVIPAVQSSCIFL